MARTSSPEIEQLAQLAHATRDELLTRFSNQTSGQPWHALAPWFAVRTGLVEPRQFADAYAQAVVCGAFAVRVGCEVLQNTAAADWLVRQADPLVESVLGDCLSPFFHRRSQPFDWPALRRVAQFLDSPRMRQLQNDLSRDHVDDAPVFFYERFLQCYDRRRRRRRGVYYTPAELVQFIVRGVEEVLCDEFQLADGLADTSAWSKVAERCGRELCVSATHAAEPFVRVLDPAMGTGAFLLGVVRRCHERFLRAPEARDARACGSLEPLRNPTPVAATGGSGADVAGRCVGTDSAGCGIGPYGISIPGYGQVSASPGQHVEPTVSTGKLSGRQRGPRNSGHRQSTFFGCLAQSAALVAGALTRAVARVRAEVADYFSIDGQPLGERKHWLEDDYVKFLRYAHWQLERSGAGVIGLVTNHGFLDNPTFRGLRQQLVNTFSHATFVDLHGNAKKQERTPDGQTDQNVFSIEQGVTVSFLRCGTAHPEHAVVEHADLWGRRADKLEALRNKGFRQLGLQRVQPESPFYFLTPRQFAGSAQYELGFSLADVMPLHSTAAVTARDHFLVGFDQLTLMERLSDFGDPQISDEEIRARYFTRTRSPRYLPGDTRGWKLPAARRTMAALSDPQRHIRDCQYRPFDRRKIFWADWMVDWPRLNVMQHLAAPGNLALVARRQMPATGPICYFWVTDSIAVDGLIRSDNRGSESVFPLWVNCREEAGQKTMPFADLQRHGRTANFTPAFVDSCCRQLGLAWNDASLPDPAHEFGPEDLLHFIYALFFSPGYRNRFASGLRVDFPRILVPHSATLFQAMAGCGAQLVRLHLLRQPISSTTRLHHAEASRGIASGYPRFDEDRVWINSQAAFAPVSSAVWQFHVGTHQVCRKWLKDRVGRELATCDIQHYGQLIEAVRQTIAIMREIDVAIEDAGGWGRAI